jgi:hypothetical protein
MWNKCDYKGNNFKGTKNLEYVEQIRQQGEQIISVLEQNQDFKRNNILAPVEQITTSREQKIRICGTNTTTRGQIISVLEQNQDFKRNNILAPVEQITTSWEQKN